MYCTKSNQKSYLATVGADFLTKDLKLGDRAVTLQIWDTAGQERFKSLVTRFYRGSDACILVYDITSMESFKKVDFWMNQFLEHANIKDKSKFPFLIVGNKQDLAAQAKVPESKLKEWCKKRKSAIYINR
eukprot:UN04505